MDSTKLIQILDSASFMKIKSKIQWLKGTSIYLKRIEEELFVIFSINPKSKQKSCIKAFVVASNDENNADDFVNPSKILFSLKVERERDLDYLKRYLA